jgi:hypothetical protein
MKPSYHDKQSYEEHILTIDVSETLATGDTITAGSLSVKAYDSDEIDVTSTIISGTPSFSGTDIQMELIAGTDGEDYNIRVRFTTTNGEKVEDDLTLRIRDKS